MGLPWPKKKAGKESLIVIVRRGQSRNLNFWLQSALPDRCSDCATGPTGLGVDRAI